MNGWIKVWRKLQDWQFYKKSDYTFLFLHIVMKARYEPTEKGNQSLSRGFAQITLRGLERETGIKYARIRTILSYICEGYQNSSQRKKYFKHPEIFKNVKNNYVLRSVYKAKSDEESSVVEVINYDLYQSDDEKVAQLLAHQSQSDRRVDTDLSHISKKDKKEKKDKNVKKEIADALNYFVDNFNSRFKGKYPTAYAFGLERKLTALSDFFPIEDFSFWDTVLDRIAESNLNWENLDSKFNIDWLLRDSDNLNRVLQGQWVNESAKGVDKFLDELLDMG